MAAAAQWRLVLGTGGELVPARGARNMAVDHALLEGVQAGAPPVLRLYLWRPACLSFGRNQTTCDVYDADRIAAAGVEVVRRPTGGLAVLHDDELTYAVAAPIDLFGGPRAAYRIINDTLVSALARLGVRAAPSAAAGTPDPRRDSAEPCFAAPAAGEVVAAGAKLIGSAQRCEKRCLLQHGSILLGGSQRRVRNFVRGADAAAADAAGDTSLADLLRRPVAPAETAECVEDAWRERFGTALARATLSGTEGERADELEAEYAAARSVWRL